MVIRKSTQPEVARLVAHLVGASDVEREAAAARLAVIGPRAVERLLGALEAADKPADRLAILQVLERVGDDRALPAAIRLLEAPEQDVTLAAIAVIRPHLNSAARAEAATALEALTGLVVDSTAREAVRAAAFDALHDLPLDVVEPLLVKLRDDESPRMRRLAGATGAETDGGHGPATLEAMAEHGVLDDPEAVRRMVLETGYTAALPVLHRLVVVLRERERSNAPRADEWLMARGAVHQVLAERGSRVALYDARETLEANREPVPLGMLTALTLVGDRLCLEAIGPRLGATSDAWLREHLVAAARAIAVRERLTSRQAAVKRLLARYPALGEAL